MKQNLKIAVVHDHLGWSGGGERTSLIMAIELGADFITAHRDLNTFSNYQKKLGKKLKVFSKKVINKEVIRFFWLRNLFWRNRKLLKEYDILIASGHAATEAVAKYASPKATKILYNHTPPRRIFDLYNESKNSYKFFLRPLFALFVIYWRIIYLRAVKKIDFNIANSRNIASRVKKYTGVNVGAVIWPPILVNNFKWIEQGDYFLSWARNDENKRVELIVKAFQKMPDKKLIIASGGNRFAQIKKIAQGYKNINVLGWVSDAQLFDLVGNAQAAIYIPRDEDAGMTQLEANAAGKPILGVAEGGLVETIINNKTGILVKINPQVIDIVKAVNTMTKEWCLKRKKDCINHAKKYDKEIFVKKIKKVVKENDPRIPVLGIDASRWENPKYPGKRKRTGVEEYSYNLIKNITSEIKGKNIILRLYTPRLIRSLPSKFQKVIPYQSQWTWRALARELKLVPPDYFFTPGYYIPKTSPENSFSVIHDVIFSTNPELYKFFHRKHLNWVTSQNIKKSKKIITISEFSKKEIMRVYGVDDSKIAVVPIGYTNLSPSPSPSPTRVGDGRLFTEKAIRKLNKERFCHLEQSEAESRDPLNISEEIPPFRSASVGMTKFIVSGQSTEKENQIIYIGRIEAKKSIDVLVRAFCKFIEYNSSWKLILAGELGYKSDEIKKLIKDFGVENKVELLGYVSEKQKWNLLKSSKILVHPSEHEGSCMPLFETWDAQTPAIVADIPVMREIGKNGALYFEPGNDKDLARNISELAVNSNLQEYLIQQGQYNLSKMSWRKAAQDVLRVISCQDPY